MLISIYCPKGEIRIDRAPDGSVRLGIKREGQITQYATFDDDDSSLEFMHALAKTIGAVPTAVKD